MGMNNVPGSGRFVSEENSSLAAYLQVALLALETQVLPAIPTAQAKAVNDLNEVKTSLRRIKWHLESGTQTAQSGGDLIARDEAAYCDQLLAKLPEEQRMDVNSAELQALLRQAIPGAGDLMVESIKLVAGGRSKLTALIVQTGCSTLPENLVFRQDWASAVTGTSVATEFELLGKLHALGILAPPCFHYEPAGNPLGAAFMIVGRLSGKVEGDIFQPPAAPPLALQLAAQLGLLHACPLDMFEGISSISERDFGAEQLVPRLQEFRAIYTAFGQNVAVIKDAFDWLEANVSRVGGRRALVHGDLGFHNFLVDGDNLTAILDWELAHYGNPAEDLGYMRGDIERMLPWGDFMAAYDKAGGQPVSVFETDFYFVWGLVRLYCLLMQARAGVKAGMVQDIAVVRVCVDAVPRLIKTLASGMAQIAASAST
jgi:aminoglycoside phosphotransferase (APT) family kinase protein